MLDANQLNDIEARVRLLKEDWVGEIDRGLKHLHPLIQDEFRVKGILGFISDPFVDMGATAYLKGLRKTALRQMDIALDCAMEAIDREDINTAVEKHFPRFLELDEIYKNARKTHHKFAEIKQSLHDEFVLRVQDTIRLLTAKSPDKGKCFTSAADVYKIAYKDISEAKRIQELELEHVKTRTDMVREDEKLLSIPFGLRSKVFKIVEKGFTYTKSTYEENLRRYFS